MSLPFVDCSNLPGTGAAAANARNSAYDSDARFYRDFSGIACNFTLVTHPQ